MIIQVKGGGSTPLTVKLVGSEPCNDMMILESARSTSCD